MVSVPSQLSAATFGSSASNSTNTNPFSGSQSPFAFGSSSGGGGGVAAAPGHQRPNTLSGVTSLYSIGVNSASLAAGRSLTPNPTGAAGPPPGLYQQQPSPQQQPPPSAILGASQQHSPGGSALPPLLGGPPPTPRNLFPSLLNGIGVTSSSGVQLPGSVGCQPLSGTSAAASFLPHNSAAGTFVGLGSPSRASLATPIGNFQSSTVVQHTLQQSKQQSQGPTSGFSSLVSAASGKDLLMRGGLYDNDLLSQAPFSSASSGVIIGPPTLNLSNSKGDSGQQSGGNTPLSLFNRYSNMSAIGNNLKGLVDFNSHHQQSTIGQNNSSTTPLGFNENEFPSLAAQTIINRGSAGFGSVSSVGPIGSFSGARAPSVGMMSAVGSRPGYANLIKQATETQPEFQIHNEDFPALPGSQENPTKQNSSPSASGDSLKDCRFLGDSKVQPQQQTQRRGIHTHSDGSVTGIPAGMLNDQFGMVGLLTFLRAIETDPSIVSLALGHDLTLLGLNLNAPEKNLYQTFSGPWSDVPCRPQDIDFHVPSEYLTNAGIADKLAPIKLNRYGEDLLFYLFYNFGGEMFQLAAAAELYNRDWRYHKEERVWLARAPGMVPIEKAANYERGTYYVFDPSHWRRIAKEMHLEYDKLEDRPMLPPQLQQPTQHIHTPQQLQQSSGLVPGTLSS